MNSKNSDRFWKTVETRLVPWLENNETRFFVLTLDSSLLCSRTYLIAPWTAKCKNICYNVFYKCFIIVFSQGRHLQRGSHLVDFDIKLGDTVCVPISLTDSQVDCRPPTSKPKGNVGDTRCPDDTSSLSVCIHVLFIFQLMLTIRCSRTVWDSALNYLFRSIILLLLPENIQPLYF